MNKTNFLIILLLSVVLPSENGFTIQPDPHVKINLNHPENDNGEKPKFYIPSEVKVYEREIYLTWNRVEGMMDCTILVKDSKRNELITLQTSDPYVVINLQAPELINEKSFTVEILTSCGNSSESYKIQHLNKSKKKKIEQIIASKIGNSEDVNADHFLVLADVYEKNGLIADALTAHIKAIEFSMDKKYKMLYNEFIMRNQLDS